MRELRTENRRWKDTKLRSSKCLNNMVEQDHRGVKSRTGPMLGCKVFNKAAITIAGIELLNRIRKVNSRLARLSVRGHAAPAIWEAVLNV